jgi:vancomycin resistance protein VanJ
MICDNCGYNNTNVSRYCDDCGARLGQRLGEMGVRRTNPIVTWARRLFLFVLMLYPLFVLGLTVYNMVQPRRTGLFALSEVFAPYLFLPLLALVPFVFMRRARMLRIALMVCALVFLVRFPPNIVASAPVSTPGAIHLSVMSWNVLTGGRYEQVMSVLRQKPASIIGIVEADWNRLSTDPEIAQLYPYRWGVQAGDMVSGQALLTAYPILEQGVFDTPADLWDMPRVIWARLDVGLGRNVVVVVAHPPPGHTCNRRTFPTRCFDTAKRDQRLARIHEYVEPFLEQGDNLIMLGDFNVTEREPAYSDLSAGLVDTHRAVGTGTGTTWRPKSLMSHPFALLRIDYIFTSPNLTPLSASADCTPRGSDHCIVQGTVEVR